VGTVPFEKYQATGNDFIVVEHGRVPDADPAWLAEVLCERREGVGADGLLLLTRGEDVWSVEVINADGSLAETSGNGMRCAFRYLLDHDRFRDDEARVVRSGAGRVEAREDGPYLAVDMGPPRFEGGNLPPLDGAVTRVRLALGTRILCGLAVSMGNPHLVIEIDPGDDLDSFPLEAAAEAAANGDAFPQGVNVEVVRRTGPTDLLARVWERGVGETRACGSGACAMVGALSMMGGLQSPVDVGKPGGRLRVAWSGEPPADLWLSGPASLVFVGSWEGPTQRRNRG